ncbi:hypothetical protein [Mycobacterium sp. 1081908.1]|uniref:hypothetical protein n=1 Tax=Mycobacterium sp. 1081908.1 TaxID=1834066 RepID=UPI0012EA34FA|nr:hypothetical protein [Mycobacterium sp. 1081908.1]
MTAATNPRPDVSAPGATVDFPEQEGPAMTTTATSTQPDVPLPAGAVADCESWAFWDNEFRIFHGPDRTVSNAAGKKIAEVRTGGIQRRDGSIDTTECPPSMDVYVLTDDGLTAEQARELAAALLMAAEELDRWAER